MKKYTKRFKHDLKSFRFIKNIGALGLVGYGAVHALILRCCPPSVLLTDTLIAFCIAIIGETLFNLGMSIIETSEIVQEKDEAV